MDNVKRVFFGSGSSNLTQRQQQVLEELSSLGQTLGDFSVNKIASVISASSHHAILAGQEDVVATLTEGSAHTTALLGAIMSPLGVNMSAVASSALDCADLSPHERVDLAVSECANFLIAVINAAADIDILTRAIERDLGEHEADRFKLAVQRGILTRFNVKQVAPTYAGTHAGRPN